MNQDSTIVGLDVHKRQITVAVLSPGAAQPNEVLTIENHAQAIVRLAKRLRRASEGCLCTKRGHAGMRCSANSTILAVGR